MADITAIRKRLYNLPLESLTVGSGGTMLVGLTCIGSVYDKRVADLIVHAPDDIAALLKALEAEKIRANANRDMAVLLDKNSADKDREYAKEIAEITSERNRYKARMEALENSIISREANETMLCHACYTCKHNKQDVDYCGEKCGRDRKNWEFDQSRFGKGESDT